MSDFITKSKPDEEFNNGGSTLGRSGGAPIDGPQSPLSETDQSDTIEDLQFADTADSSQSGPISVAADGQLQAQADDTPDCPPEHPVNSNNCCGNQDVAYFTISGLRLPAVLDKPQARDEFNQWKAYLGPAWTPKWTNLFKPSFVVWFMTSELPMGKCGCWTSLIGLTDLFGAAVGWKLARNVLRYFLGVRGLRNKMKEMLLFELAKSPKLKGKYINPDYFNKWLDDFENTFKDQIPNPIVPVKLKDGTEVLIRIDNPIEKLVMKILGVTIELLAQIALQRPKMCFGENVRLNPYTCECECATDEMEECGIASMPQAWLYDIISPNFLPSAEELKSCGKCDCNLDLGANSLGCKCTTCISGYTWKTGRCDCSRDIQIVNTGNGTYPAIQYTWAKQPGKCIRDDVIAVEEGLGKIWDPETCSWQCPAGSDVAENRSCGLYARLNDNLGSDAPSKGHYLYRQGCNCVCDGRDQLADGTLTEFPPNCEEIYSDNYVWDGSATVCACVPCPVRQYACTDSSSVDDCANCPPGYTCDPGDPENGISAGCSIVTEVGGLVFSPFTPTVESSEDCEALLGVAPHGGIWYPSYDCV